MKTALISTRSDKHCIVCAWCPDKVLITFEMEQAGYSVSHGCCDSCKEDALKKAKIIEDEFEIPTTTEIIRENVRMNNEKKAYDILLAKLNNETQP